MYWSRATLAIIEAAETSRILASALTQVEVNFSRAVFFKKLTLPSIMI